MIPDPGPDPNELELGLLVLSADNARLCYQKKKKMSDTTTEMGPFELHLVSFIFYCYEITTSCEQSSFQQWKNLYKNYKMINEQTKYVKQPQKTIAKKTLTNATRLALNTPKVGGWEEKHNWYGCKTKYKNHLISVEVKGHISKWILKVSFIRLF